MESGRGRGECIDLRIDEADAAVELLIHPGDQAGPERRHRAGPADRHCLAVDKHVVARVRITGAGDVWHAATLITRRIERRRNARILLIVGDGKRSTHAASACSKRAIGPGIRRGIGAVLIPNRFGLDGDLGRDEAGSTTGQREWARRREIDMGFAIPDIWSHVGSTVVPCRNAHRDAQQSRRLEHLIELRLEAAVGDLFRTTPTDRDDRGVVRRVVHRLGDRVEEAFRRSRIGCEIDHDRCAGRNGSGDLDVERDLDVVTAGVRRSVRRSVDRHGNHGRRRNAEPLKIGLQILRTIPAAQLDDSDRLARSVRAGRKVVDRCHVVRVKRVRGGRVLGRLGCNAKVGLRDWSGVEAEHTGDDRSQFRRDLHGSNAPAVGAGRMCVDL